MCKTALGPGISDGVNAAVLVAQGDYAGASLSLASIAVPFGADKLAQAVSRVLTTAIARSAEAFAEAGLKRSDELAELTTKSSRVVDKAEGAKGLVQCTDGSNCFTAGHRIVVQDDSKSANDGNSEFRWSFALATIGGFLQLVRARLSPTESPPTRSKRKRPVGDAPSI